MTNPFANLASTLINTFGVPCSAFASGSYVSFKGQYRNETDYVTQDGQTILNEIEVIRVTTTLANTLAYDQQITVNGVNYLVGRKSLETDGNITKISLKKVEG